MNTPSSKGVQVVAHRGASGYAPETTLDAYRLALGMSVDFVEMDARMLRDGTLVAMHDGDVKRTTGGKGRLSELTLAQLKTLDAGNWFNKTYPEKARPEYVGLRVPTVQEIMDLLHGSSTGCYIEIKDPEQYPPNLESELLALIYKNGMEKRTRILSFDAQSIGKIKLLDSSMPTALLVSRRGRNPVTATLRIPADELGLRYNLATAAVVDAAHESGLSISVWTVDRETDMKRVIRLGVDRIITNYPDRLIQLLR